MNGRWSHIRGVLLDKDGTILDYERTWLPINRQIALAAARGEQNLADQLLRAGGQDPATGRIVPDSPFAAGTVDETTVDENDGHCCTCGISHDEIPYPINAESERIRLQHCGAILREHPATG